MEIVFVFFITVVCIDAKAIIGKAFLCRDPDTGKLHTVDSTWPSSTFCGNYHCKIRQKITPNSEKDVLRQIKITNDETGNQVPIKDPYHLVSTDYELFKKIYNNNNIDMTRVEEHSSFNSEIESSTVSDRYLTANEIKAISTILHTLKKSDLNAIIELYYMAQNIYDEFEKSNLTGLVQDSVNNVNQDITKSKIYKSEETKQNYWYDPLPTDKHPRVSVMSYSSQSSEITKARQTTPKHTSTSASYYNGSLTSKGFGQELYAHPKVTVSRPIDLHQPLVVLKTHYSQPSSNIQKIQGNNLKYRTDIQPSFYLPYPFSHTRYYHNRSIQQPLYQIKNYVERSVSSNKKKTISLNDNATFTNSFLEKVYGSDNKYMDKQRKRQSKIKMTSGKSKQLIFHHDWETSLISRSLLEEIKPPLTKTKVVPFSIKKKQKLDRVIKMIALNDVIKRTRRSTGQVTFEAYLDKTTCKSDVTVPGYFRYGNLSQPFPECCPQRI